MSDFRVYFINENTYVYEKYLIINIISIASKNLILSVNKLLDAMLVNFFKFWYNI